MSFLTIASKSMRNTVENYRKTEKGQNSLLTFPLIHSHELPVEEAVYMQQFKHIGENSFHSYTFTLFLKPLTILNFAIKAFTNYGLVSLYKNSKKNGGNKNVQNRISIYFAIS